ncbi:MAG: hypothetical protein QOI45_1070 [Thermoleophilaceae bacterium]|nr:hypothetical protein [Thermoleophilaceae bacterium]
MTDLVNLADTTVVKVDNGFCLALADGRLPIDSDHPLGLYLDDCRHLRGHELWMHGSPPRLLISSDSAGTAAAYELTNPDLELANGSKLPLQSLRVRLERRIMPGRMVDLISVRSYTREAVEFELELRLDADFQPMLEVRGAVPPAKREVRTEARGHSVRFSAIGVDGKERSTLVTCAGAVAKEQGSLCVGVDLEPGAQRTLEVRFELATPDTGPAPRVVGERRGTMADAGAEADAWLTDHPRVEMDNDLLDRFLRRSLLDLRLLASELDGHTYYAAGVPWYATLFGRDSIIASLQTLAFDPAMAEETLRLLAGRLGQRVDDEHDEEPGKVLHELRRGELAERGLTPLVRYYGTVDATPLFLCLVCEHTDWTGSLDLFRELRPQIDQALTWIDEYGDLDGDGLLEYRRRSPGGLDNQGWKDSWDGIVDEHGDVLRAPIAVVEAQGYALAAKRRLARLFELEGDVARAEQLRAGAARMAEALERFWLSDRGFYSMALDGDKRPSRALASNQGHLLWALAVPHERAEAIRHALTSPAVYSGWGVRTLSGDEPAFNPVGYHAGTIWPHDNAFFAVGLRKYGFDEAFLRVFEGLLDAASSFSDYRLPELFAGFARTDYEDPVPYPVACTPQAWAAGSLPWMLTAGLGLMPDGLERRLHIRRPALPRQVGRLALHGLEVAGSRVDLVFERVAEGTDRIALTDVQIEGDLDVVLDPVRSGRRRTRTYGT